MIKNEREYKITKASLAKFEQSLAFRVNHQGSALPGDAAKLKLQEAAARSMRCELQEQIYEYEQLRAGRFDLAALDVVEAIPSSLIRARIAAGWTQKELAKRLGTSEQQIQKYESTDYESASFRKIHEIVTVLKAASEARQSEIA
jgi:ribosome-binding protein aMBF1 (putative translation factor)